MLFKRFPGRPRSEAAQFLANLVAQKSVECQWFPYEQKLVAWAATSKKPTWVTCRLANGPPEIGQVPVRTCGVYGCINGYHHRWGTQSESQSGRVFKSRAGGRNPNAKLSDLEVEQLRSVNWGNGRWKKQAAESAGVSVRTLNAILKGWSRPVIKLETEDEF